MDTATSRPGGRTARTRTAVRDATLVELAEHGYTGMTVENVATRSGVHKTTLYRRWGGVDGLIVDALELARDDDWTPQDTGTLAGDLTALAEEVRTVFADPLLGPASTAFVAASFHSPRAADAFRAFLANRHTRSTAIVTRAVDRGDAPPGTDAGAVVRATVAPLYYRLLISHEPVTDETVAQTITATLAAVTAGAFTR